VLRAAKRVVSTEGDPGAAVTGRWTADWTDMLLRKLRALRVTQDAVVAQQTQWTPEMLQLVLWVTYYQRAGVALADVLVPLNAILPRSNEEPPDDGVTGLPPAPRCMAAATTPNPGAATQTTAGRALVLAQLERLLPSLNWQVSRWNTGEALAARWGVQKRDGTVFLCADQGHSVIVLAKIALSVAGAVDPTGPTAGTWDASWHALLYRRATEEWGLAPSQIPFAPTDPGFTRESLAFLLWGAFYRGVADAYTSILLPAQTELPRFGQPLDPDGWQAPLEPLCAPMVVGSVQTPPAPLPPPAPAPGGAPAPPAPAPTVAPLPPGVRPAALPSPLPGAPGSAPSRSSSSPTTAILLLGGAALGGWVLWRTLRA
jgi:hypothetical protein